MAGMVKKDKVVLRNGCYVMITATYVNTYFVRLERTIKPDNDLFGI